MKKQLSLFALILTTAISCKVQCQEMPKNREMPNYQIGLFTRFSKQRTTLTPAFSAIFDQDQSTLYSCFSGVGATYPIGERFAVLANLGSYSQRFRISTDTELGHSHCKEAFGYEIGCKINIYEQDCLKVIFEPTYFRSKGKVKSYDNLYRNSGTYYYTTPDNYGRIHQKIASSLLVEGDCCSAQLYGGVRVAYDRFHNLKASTSPVKQLRAKNTQKIGMTAGCRVPFSERFGLNVEGRAFDENAVSGNIYFNY